MARRQIPNGFWITAVALALSSLACGSTGPDGTLSDSDESELSADPRGALRAARLSISRSAIAPTLAPYVAHSDYVAANVPFDPATTLRGALEGRLRGLLKNRGEAHVTPVTPGEMGKLRQRLTAREVEDLAIGAGVQQAVLTPKCVGMGEKGRDRTFYLVVESSDLMAVRTKIAAAFYAKGGARDAFDATAFFPHVTLGFTKRDLHASDGTVKSVASCPNPEGLEVRR